MDSEDEMLPTLPASATADALSSEITAMLEGVEPEDFVAEVRI